MNEERETYHAPSGAITATAIKAGAKSMLEMRAAMIGERREPTPTMIRGTLIHRAVLEPERFAATVACWQGGRKAGKEFDAFSAAADGKDVVSVDEMRTIEAVRDEVMTNEDAARLVVQSEHERRVDWTGERYGAAKALVDMLGPSGAWVADLKTAADIEERGFVRQCINLGYFLQMAWYRVGTGALDVFIVACETSAPFDVAVYKIPQMALDVALRRCERIAARYRACEAAGTFPGVADGNGVREFDVPVWFYDDEPDAQEIAERDEIEAAGL